MPLHFRYCIMLDDEFVLDGGGINLNKDNLGNYPNDCFDDNLVNANIEVMKYFGDDKWIFWCLILGNDNLEDGDEVFVRYGKKYWIYLPNFLTLPIESQTLCKEYYKIEDNEFWDCEVGPAAPETTLLQEVGSSPTPKRNEAAAKAKVKKC